MRAKITVCVWFVLSFMYALFIQGVLPDAGIHKTSHGLQIFCVYNIRSQTPGQILHCVFSTIQSCSCSISSVRWKQSNPGMEPRVNTARCLATLTNPLILPRCLQHVMPTWQLTVLDRVQLFY